jgi:hypothetical protein
MTDQPQSTALARLPETQRSAVLPGVAGFDGNSFELMQRLATLMASSTLVPEHLRKGTPQERLANCFLVVNQANRWGMDPFAVAQSVAVIAGKLCYEGKLVAAVLAAKLGVKLRYEWDNQPGEKLGIVVSGDIDGATQSVRGTAAEWKTTRQGTPWIPSQYRKMLAYRGAREWARLYAPEVMLGIYTADELGDLEHARRAEAAHDITPKGPPPAPPRLPRVDPPAEPGTAAEDAPFPDPDVYLTHLEEEMVVAGDAATLKEVWDAHLESSAHRLSPKDRERADVLFVKHSKEIARKAKAAKTKINGADGDAPPLPM